MRNLGVDCSKFQPIFLIVYNRHDFVNLILSTLFCKTEKHIIMFPHNSYRRYTKCNTRSSETPAAS
jgi:hypothetical protein